MSCWCAGGEGYQVGSGGPGRVPHPEDPQPYSPAAAGRGRGLWAGQQKGEPHSQSPGGLCTPTADAVVAVVAGAAVTATADVGAGIEMRLL